MKEILNYIIIIAYETILRNVDIGAIRDKFDFQSTLITILIANSALSDMVSQKVLTAQLRDMKKKELLTRKVYAEVLLRIEYAPTETGYSLKSVLDAMWAWGTDYQTKNG